jgi:glycosyltransferase involved in cell wall biosynthesis
MATLEELSAQLEAIREGQLKKIHAAGNTAALADCLRRAILMPAEARVAMGRRARAVVEGRNSTGLMVRRFEALYDELLSRP